MPTTVDPELYAQALAEIRALRPKPTTEQQVANDRRPTCCTGDRNGYQWHRRTRNLPACEKSSAANRAYIAAYKEARRLRQAAA